MIVTIDGPAGAGKSSASRCLARRLGFRFLDTGAMYRAVALAALERGIAWEDSAQLAELARSCHIDVNEDRVLLNGVNVTSEIRKLNVTSVIHHVAEDPEVRSTLVELQRRIASQGDYVTEGRDQGTVVFPDADCKFFLTASPEERARRRMHDLYQRGEYLPFDEVLNGQNVRDARDETREFGRLVQAPDAIRVNTDGLDLPQVVERLEALARERISASQAT
jgi:CMP/dCMP kinase